MTMATRVPDNAVGRQVLADVHEARERRIQEAGRRARHPNRLHRFWRRMVQQAV
ncbi:hypothetical protein [Alloalcanivorax xenomutans]|uniref:hypothetical protein n=1 Tax=Alloalcanivorax xenomutans TaxID=1094342 RepID=UPI0006D5CEA7|nr:hypothetical protein [Alloalcanivorax xenomutans]CUR48461.1 hypothetical protein BN2364_4020 [Alloalcanivorax xenomutans]